MRTFKEFKEYLEEKGRCWSGYKPVPGKKAFSKGSCEVKEEVEQIDELQTNTMISAYAKRTAQGQTDKADKIRARIKQTASKQRVHDADNAALAAKRGDLGHSKSHEGAYAHDKAQKAATAVKKANKKPGFLSKMFNREEVEELDELNYDTVKSLYQKRRADFHGAQVGKKKKGKDVSAKNVSTSISRLMGNKPTQNQPVKEEEEYDVEELFDILEEVVNGIAEESNIDPEILWENLEDVSDEELYETAAWRRKEGKNPTGGLNAKGIASYRRENPGSTLKKAVTGKVKPGSKAAKRRKSFCARMGGMPGAMKKPNGEPTRKALALRKWKCR